MTDTLRPVVWVGDVLDKLREFPEAVRKDLGDALQLAQWGVTPAMAKPFKGIGPGVYALVERHNKNTYRAVRLCR